MTGRHRLAPNHRPHRVRRHRVSRRALLRGAAGDRGSIVLAMLVTLVATAVAALILPVFLVQADATTFDSRRVVQLAAAQSGIEVAIAQIRAASDADGAGKIGSLPCAPVTGLVDGTSNQRFRVQIAYYSKDPQHLNAAELAADRIACATATAGGTLGTISTPSFVLLQADGTDVAGTAWDDSVPARSVQATYVVKTTNANIVGGLFHVYKTATSTDLCLDAGLSTLGTTITMQPCDTTNPAQRWAYLPNLTIVLATTQSQPETLCIDGGGTPEVADTVPLTVGTCGNPVKYQQVWSLNDSAGMQGTDNGSALNRLCWKVQAPDVAGSQVVLSTQCSGPHGYDNTYSWQPDAAVGAGASGATNNELVNYAEFGRCLDVTNQNVFSLYLIAWPCKQTPNPANVTWNQRWSLPALTDGVGTGPITTTPNIRFCLTSPGNILFGHYVLVLPCPLGVVPTAMMWTVRGKVGTYAASYQIEDAYGFCLQPTDPGAPLFDFAHEGNGISKIVVAPCSASTLQKWNAPPNIDEPSVKDQQER